MIIDIHGRDTMAPKTLEAWRSRQMRRPCAIPTIPTETEVNDKR